MALYTRKGDGGTTKIFGCDQKLSKSSAVAEALGAMDELNSLLGFCKVKSQKVKVKPKSLALVQVLEQAQHNLFIIQAELAGAAKMIVTEKVSALEKIIDEIENELPPIKSFFIAGGTELAALLDYARTVARRAERRVVRAREEKQVKIGEATLAYLNRLSSLLYALARLVNHRSGIKEQSPHYR